MICLFPVEPYLKICFLMKIYNEVGVCFRLFFSVAIILTFDYLNGGKFCPNLIRSDLILSITRPKGLRLLHILRFVRVLKKCEKYDTQHFQP